MNIQVSDEQIRSVVAATIFEVIPEEQRAKLLKDALAKLLQPEPEPYGRTSPSPLQQAMTQAVERLAHEIIKDRFASSEVIATISGMVDDAIRQVTEIDRATTVTRMAHAFSRALADMKSDR